MTKQSWPTEHSGAGMQSYVVDDKSEVGELRVVHVFAEVSD